MDVEIIHDQSLGKYGTRPGPNSQPLDLQSDTYLQSDMLPTVLRSRVWRHDLDTKPLTFYDLDLNAGCLKPLV